MFHIYYTHAGTCENFSCPLLLQSMNVIVKNPSVLGLPEFNTRSRWQNKWFSPLGASVAGVSMHREPAFSEPVHCTLR
jgi:hypothetical protein